MTKIKYINLGKSMKEPELLTHEGEQVMKSPELWYRCSCDNCIENIQDSKAELPQCQKLIEIEKMKFELLQLRKRGIMLFQTKEDYKKELIELEKELIGLQAKRFKCLRKRAYLQCYKGFTYFRL